MLFSPDLTAALIAARECLANDTAEVCDIPASSIPSKALINRSETKPFDAASVSEEAKCRARISMSVRSTDGVVEWRSSWWPVRILLDCKDSFVEPSSAMRPMPVLSQSVRQPITDAARIMPAADIPRRSQLLINWGDSLSSRATFAGPSTPRSSFAARYRRSAVSCSFLMQTIVCEVNAALLNGLFAI